MKRLLMGAMFLALVMVIPISTMAAVEINIGIPLPPPVVFAAPPEVIVIPDTSVYVDPEIDADLYFWNGWWWRLWEGHWYRSRYYDRAWVYYSSVPTFYFDIDPGWRVFYRDHDWHGHRWNYERVPYRQLHQNWKTWQDNRHWERRGAWGVQGYHPLPQKERQELRHTRQEEYQRRPEVVRHQEQIQKQQRQPQIHKPQAQERREPQGKSQQQPQIQQPERKRQTEQQHSEPQGLKQQGGSQHQQSHEKPEKGGDGEHKK